MSNPTLVAALKRKFGTVKGHGEWLRIPCPTCAPHNRKKMKRYVPAHGFSSSCFICGIRQSIYDLLEGDYIVTKADMEYKEETPEEIDPRSFVLPYITSIPVNKLEPDHPAVKFLAKDYLTDLDKYANVNKIVYVPYEGGKIFNNGTKFITSAERIVFPVYHEDKLVGWQMRSLPGTFYGDMDEDVRYYHLFNKGSFLYNYDQARQHKRVVVVEGVKKALKFPNGVATWGAGISRKQLQLIQTWPEVIMMLDSDEGNNTQQRAKEFVSNINLGGSSRAINVDLRKYGVSSPDDLPSEILQSIVEDEWNEQLYNKK
jgi:hypothetical protein